MTDAADICDQRQDAYAVMSEGPEDIPTCPMCGKQGYVWRHPNLECQAFFDELASEWCLAEGQEANTKACSNACWVEFVLLSQGDHECTFANRYDPPLEDSDFASWDDEPGYW